MAKEDLELVRRAVESYNRRDIDGLLRDWAADAVVDWSNSRGLEAGIYRGHDEIRDLWQRFFAAFDEIRLEEVDLEEVEEGVLVFENTAFFKGRDGIEVQARSVWLIRIQDGQQTSLTLYQTREEAAEAAGLG